MTATDNTTAAAASVAKPFAPPVDDEAATALLLSDPVLAAKVAAARAAYKAAMENPPEVPTLNFVQLLESELQVASTRTNVATADALAGKKVIGLYFSAHWCAPCVEFTPILAQVYDDIKDLGDEFADELEIVFVSYDKTPEEFAAYADDMPWLALPFAKRELQKVVSKVFSVFGIPQLMFVDAHGDLITRKGRELVEEHAADTTALLQALHKGGEPAVVSPTPSRKRERESEDSESASKCDGGSSV